MIKSVRRHIVRAHRCRLVLECGCSLLLLHVEVVFCCIHTVRINVVERRVHISLIAHKLVALIAAHEHLPDLLVERLKIVLLMGRSRRHLIRCQIHLF